MSPAAAPGRVLGDRYRLVSPIARGGMATVWAGEDVLLSRRVAVKTLHPELALDDGLRDRFRREAIAAAKLGHPDIVATYDTGEDDDVAYIVMELVDGPTLRSILDDHGPMPVPEALRVAREVTAALDHAHRHGVVHRDIKPANVLIPPEGPVKVTDFGIAKAAGASDLTRTGTVVGTARYLAPEQLEGATSDARTDVYAVGLLMYEMLVGRLPFGGDTEMAAAIARVTAAAPAVRNARPDVALAVDELVARCLERDPDARPQNAVELASALDAAGAAGGTPLSPPLSVGYAAATGTRTRAVDAGTDARTAVDALTSVDAVAAPTDPGMPRPDVHQPRPRRRRRSNVLVALLTLVVLGAGGYLVARAVSGGNGSGGPPTTTAANGGPRIAAAKDFDPFGGDGEHPEAVGLAIDKNPATFWYTSTYETPTMSKPGVGIYVQLAGTARVRTVDVDAVQSGWNAAIYAANSPGATLDKWGQPLAQGTNLGTHAHFTLQPPTSARYVLLWLTRLPLAPTTTDGTTPINGYRLEVSEIRVG